MMNLVSYVQTLLYSWGSANGLPPKCDLRILPKTIDEFMKRHTNQLSPIIWSAKVQSQETLNTQPVNEIAQMLTKQIDETTSIVRPLQANATKQNAAK